jgi:predicted aconitase with swiveling domain
VLYALAKKGFAPRAIVNEKIDPVVVVGAVIAEIPMIAEVDIQQIATGDIVDVDACSGVVRILKSKR